jgi:hypothetical protein
MSCPVGRPQWNPCPNKPCEYCITDWSERAAIIEFDGKVPHAQAEQKATELLREQLARAESPQMEIKL